jgi:hypothetical protein
MVGSTEASASLLARVGVVGPTLAGARQENHGGTSYLGVHTQMKRKVNQESRFACSVLVCVIRSSRFPSNQWLAGSEIIVPARRHWK